MPRSSLLLGLLLLAVGCGTSDRELVYVNVDQIPASLVSIESPPSAKIPELPSSSAGIPALPERSISLGDIEARVKRAQAVIAENRRAAQIQIARELKESYELDLAREFRAKRDALNQGKDDEFVAVTNALRDRFMTYANQRGPLVARLALLADFPDSDPRSLRPSDPKQRIEAERIAEAKSMRSKIAALDQTYRVETDSFLAAVDVRYRGRLGELERELEAGRKAAEIRAEAAARKQLQDAVAISSILEKQTITNLPSEPSRSVTVPGSSKGLDVKVKSHSPLPSVLSNQDELEVWAATHNYTLTKGKGRNATQEFLKWRKQRNPGP